MTAAITSEGPRVLQQYYEVLGAGVEKYGDGGSLLGLLGEDFVFEGPIAGRMAGGGRFTHGVRGFIEAVRAITVLQVVSSPGGAAVLYDADLPGGVVRFSEFFVLDGERIRELRIHYDAAAYLAAGGH
jgi:hypothetical protein